MSINGKEKIIVITGVSKGLGYALMERFAADGHRVFGCARRMPATHSAESVSLVDVGVAEEVGEWAERLLGDFTAPDILINNAAVVTKPAPLWEVPTHQLSRIVDINIKGVLHCIHSFVPAMVAKNQGLIVNMSSEWGRSVSSRVAPYCTTKWAIEGLTRALAEDLPSGVAAVALNPGIIDTDMLKTVFGSEAANYPSPEEWAQKAAPYILNLSPKDSGKPMSVR